MNKKIILTDVDGVLLDWVSGFEDFMAQRGYPIINENSHSYSLSVRHGISDLESYKLAEEFNHSIFIRDLSPCSDAVEYVEKLHDAGFSFIAITSLSSDKRAKENRKINLSAIFGTAISKLYCLPLGEQKKVILNKHWGNSGLFWIEDHAKNALDGAEVGLKSILVDQPYNQHDHDSLLYARVSRESAWQEIYNIVRKAYDEIPV